MIGENAVTVRNTSQLVSCCDSGYENGATSAERLGLSALVIFGYAEQGLGCFASPAKLKVWIDS
ncbi:MAG: hypothetical protein M3539_03535 [Acidobacteriota bacterium]|nr:hypothetical protein [Acidobacteriota bacterium]